MTKCRMKLCDQKRARVVHHLLNAAPFHPQRVLSLKTFTDAISKSPSGKQRFLRHPQTWTRSDLVGSMSIKEFLFLKLSLSCEGGEGCMNPLTKKENEVQEDEFTSEDKDGEETLD